MSRVPRALLALLLLAAAPAAAQSEWSPFAEASVVQIVTSDADGAERDTNVWFVVVDDAGFVRTNDSRWLANIRRGSNVVLRLDVGVLADEQLVATVDHTAIYEPRQASAAG